MRQFSVLMSVYKKETPDHLKTSLESVFTQTVLPSEVILVEDGPLSPELDSVIREYSTSHPELRTLKFAKNRGLGKSLHDGLNACNYNLVARMDTDDVCMPNRFERQLLQFERNRELDVCTAWMDEFEGSEDNVVSVKRLPETHAELYQFGKKRNPVNHPVSMFRKDSVMKVGNYQDCPLFEDYNLWVRMMSAGCQFYCIQESLLKFRRSADMIRRRGGWKYAMTELRFLCMMYNMGYINLITLIKNSVIRFSVRIMPNTLRMAVYKIIRG